jgi:TetR/AcrR family transcriptional regulator, multidrug resistance operon repressor
MRPRDPEKEAAVKAKALELFVKHGFEGLSMHKLAEAAGVSPATLYIYYEDREDLILSLFEEESEKMADISLRNFSPDMPFREGLRVQWINRAHYCLENPDAMHFLEQVKFSPLYEKAQKRMSNHFVQAMRAFVGNAIRKGELIDIPVEIYWSIAFAPLYQLVKFHMQGRSFPGRGKFLLHENHLNLTLNLVLQSLTPPLKARV